MTKISYAGYRFPPAIIQQAIWLYLRFTLSFRDAEDLLAERGIVVSYETVRRWVNHFGPMIAADLRKRRPKPHSIWHLDEVYLKIDGRMAKHAFKMSPMNGRKGRESGRRRYGQDAYTRADGPVLLTPPSTTLSSYPWRSAKRAVSAHCRLRCWRRQSSEMRAPGSGLERMRHSTSTALQRVNTLSHCSVCSCHRDETVPLAP